MSRGKPLNFAQRQKIAMAKAFQLEVKVGIKGVFLIITFQRKIAV